MEKLRFTSHIKIVFLLSFLLLIGLAASALTPFGQRVAAQYLPWPPLTRLAARASLPAPVVPMFAAYVVNDLGDGAANAANCPGPNCRLRDAIAAANATPDDDVITFNGNGTITLTQGELSIANNGKLTITGNGASQTIISGNNVTRVFNVVSGAQVTFENLTIANGKVSGGDFSFNQGGGIFNAGTLTISNSTLTGNSVSGGVGSFNEGGGIANLGTLTISHSTISNNTASGGNINQGGGIFNNSTVTISHSTLSNNTASGGGGGNGGNGFGAAIFNLNGTVTITSSTLAANTVTAGAGGLATRRAAMVKPTAARFTIWPSATRSRTARLRPPPSPSAIRFWRRRLAARTISSTTSAMARKPTPPPSPSATATS